MKRSAMFSEDRRYRYLLSREWGQAGAPRLCYVLLNPSIADEAANDPTLARCETRAMMMGYSAIDVVNLFALVATLPEVLRRDDDPVGPRNDEVLLETAARAAQVICGWGNHGWIRGRGALVLEMLRIAGVKPQALKLTVLGHPWHPLYLPYDLQPVAL